MNCNVCGVLLPITYKKKKTCKKCSRAVKAKDTLIPLNVVEDKARNLGLSYGQLQALEYMKQQEAKV